MERKAPISLKAEHVDDQFVQRLRADRVVQLQDSWQRARLGSFYQHWEQFFASPEKSAFEHKSGLLDGFFPMRSERARNALAADPKEFFHYYEQGICPQALRTETQALFDHLKRMAVRLLALLDRALPVNQRTQNSLPLTGMIDDSSSVVLRIAHYPLSVSETAELAATHEDINLITLLPPATTGGLEVQTSDGTWVDVSPRIDAVSVLAGDMLAIATRNYFQASTHRVARPHLAGQATHRLSLNFFVNPSPTIKLNENQTAAEVLAERLREIGYT